MKDTYHSHCMNMTAHLLYDYSSLCVGLLVVSVDVGPVILLLPTPVVGEGFPASVLQDFLPRFALRTFAE